ncbi:MAG: hypothetical protein AAGH90_11395, partial [Pseudomonadota bacterium]
ISGSADRSLYGDFNIGLGVQTRLFEELDFALGASVSGVQYDSSAAPSNRQLGSSASLGYAIPDTPLYVRGTLFGGVLFDEDFDNTKGTVAVSLR